MTLTGIILVLISATFHVGWNFLTKSSSNPRAFSLIKGTAVIGISAIVLSLMPLHMIPRTVWLYVVLSGVVHAFYILAISTAYVKGDISYVYPIARSAPAFVPVAAFFIFGERISLKGGIGIFIVLVSIFLLQFQGEIRKESKGLLSFIGQKESLWAFITLATIFSYSLILHVMRTEHLGYIVTLRQSSILIAVMAGWIILREKHGPLRLMAAMALITGLFLVATAE